jgi:hypothetical protein
MKSPERVSRMRSRNSVTAMFHPELPRQVGGRLLALASLAAFVGYAGAQVRQDEGDVNAARRAATAAQIKHYVQLFDQLVFRADGGAAGAHRRLDAQLTSWIQDLDRACTLTDAQKQKLRLAGRGDICRFFASYEGVKQKGESLDPEDQNVRVILRDANSLRATFDRGLFHEDSLLYKSLPNTLTAEQLARYDARARERRASHHRASAEEALRMLLQRGISLRDAQRRELLDLMAKEIKPSRRASRHDQYRVLIQLGRLPEDKLKPLFDDAQWNALRQQLAQFKALEPQLIKVGMLPVEDDEADEPPGAWKE